MLAVPRFVPVADHGLLVEFATDTSSEASAAVLHFDRVLAGAALRGVLEVQPALVNVLVEFDPLLTDHVELTTAIRRLTDSFGHPTDAAPRPTATATATATSRVVEVCYHESLAPDLSAVATATASSPEAVLARHVAAEYVVAMYGFAPGYAYLSGVDPSIQVPRKPAPVRDVPAGSVLVAGPQCLVSTLTMPTGWSNIGRSPTEILPTDEHRGFLFDVGDRVRFEEIDLATFERITAGRDAGHRR